MMNSRQFNDFSMFHSFYREGHKGREVEANKGLPPFPLCVRGVLRV
jgi:hypothetical protein